MEGLGTEHDSSNARLDMVTIPVGSGHHSTAIAWDGICFARVTGSIPMQEYSARARVLAGQGFAMSSGTCEPSTVLFHI